MRTRMLLVLTMSFFVCAVKANADKWEAVTSGEPYTLEDSKNAVVVHGSDMTDTDFWHPEDFSTQSRLNILDLRGKSSDQIGKALAKVQSGGEYGEISGQARQLAQKAVAAEEGGGGAAELAALLQDPLANISALMTDNTFSFRTGSENDRAYEFNLQPVYSINFPELGWTVIPRATIPIIGVKPGADLPRLSDDSETVQGRGGGERKWGLSDIVTQFFFTPMGQEGVKFGAGPMMSWKTQTSDHVQGPGWGAGPVGVMVGGGEVFGYAALFGHLWAFDGDFSTTFTQPMLFYNPEFLPGAYVAYNNTISYDHKGKANNSDKWTVPLGLTVGKTFDMGGGHGFDLGLGGYHLPSWGRTAGGAEYQVKLGVTWIFPR